MTDNLTTLLHDTAQRVPTRLHPAADLRRNAQHHQRERRAGAGVLAVFLLAGAIGLGLSFGDGNNQSFVPPAEQPPLSEKALLIGDEVDPFFLLSRLQVDVGSTEGEGSEPVTSCQRGTISAFEPTDIWHRTFRGVSPDEHEVTARQLTAQFASVKQASDAIDAIGRWFDDCPGIKAPVQRWPLLSAFGGEAETVRFFRPAPDADVNMGGEVSRVESVSYGIRQSAITIISTSVIWSEDLVDPATSENDPLRMMSSFALQRLAGTRTTTENAVPEDFSFVGAAETAPIAEASYYLGDRWWTRGCDFLDLRSTDASRVGFRSLGDVGGAVVQLAIYPDEETAKAAAAELRSVTSDCTSTEEARQRALEAGAIADIRLRIQWVNEQGRASGDMHVAWSPEEAIPPKPTDSEMEKGGYHSATALALAQRGTFVLVAVKEAAFIESDEQPSKPTVAKAPALDAVQRAIEANLEAVCKLPNAECR